MCIGFIVNSSEVKRGYEGDCILGLECPTVFVTGQLSIFSPYVNIFFIIKSKIYYFLIYIFKMTQGFGYGRIKSKT